jgi:Inner membrane protein YgaP-like, transmembrane domain
MNTRKNLGWPDRMMRIVMGVVLLSIISLAYIGPKTPWAYLGLLGILPIIAGLAGYCPPYKLLGINTYHKEKTTS